MTKQEQCSYESTNWLSKEFVYSLDGHLLRDSTSMGLFTDYVYDPETGFYRVVLTIKDVLPAMYMMIGGTL